MNNSIIAESKDGVSKLLIYQESVLMLDKSDSITFDLKNEHINYTIKFIFSPDGEGFTTNVLEDFEKKFVQYQLNNWDSNSYVEVKPVQFTIFNDASKYWMKFRNTSAANVNHRRFEISIWKEVNDGN